MSEQPDVSVRLDDRIRLMSALLAATDWPDKSQEKKPHGTHAHSRATRKFLHDHRDHPAVQGTQNLLNQGAPLEAMFTLAMYLQWPSMELETVPKWLPPNWNKQIRDFYEKSGIEAWWQKEHEVWDKSVKEAKRVFDHVHFKDFLKPFLGEITENFVFIPNISYPTDDDIGVRLPKELLCIAPPPMAWGDSPPWPYDEETRISEHTYRVSLTQYGRMLLTAYMRANTDKLTDAQKSDLPVTDQFKALHPTWEDQFVSLFVAAAVAMYLEDYVSEAESKSYLMMEKRTRGMTILPGTVSVLRRYLSELGNKYESLIDFLPIFPKQLRIAKKIVTL